jgi:threonyl-tRNA synthetase
LPLWLAPVQVAVLPVSEQQDLAAREVVDALRSRGLRAELRCGDSLGSRVRRARHRRDALVAVVGAREAAQGSVEVTDVAGDHREVMTLERLGDRAVDAYARRLPVVDWAR